MSSRPKVGLALSGGGARGFAHLGVLRVLEELGIAIDVIAGTSVGSMVGGLYAAGYSVDDLRSLATTLPWQELFSSTPPRRFLFFEQKKQATKFLLDVAVENRRPVLPGGLTAGERLSNLLSLLTISAGTTRDFDQLSIPFRAVATDIVSGATVVLDGSQLPLAEAIRASVAIPGILTPVEVGEQLLVDGGLANNVPVDVVRSMGADVVIAVNVSAPLRSKAELQSFLAVVNQAVSLQIARATEAQLALADVVITPELAGFSAAAFSQGAALIARGEEAARAASDELAALVPEASDTGRKPQTTIESRRELASRTVRIDEVRLEGKFGPRDLQRLEALDIRPGEMTAEALEHRTARIWGAGFFDAVNFTLVEDPPGRNVLRVRVRKRNPVVLQFGARYDDMDGAVGIAGLTASDFGGPGGVVSTEVQFGGVFGAEASYLRHGLGATGFFVRPRVFYRDDFEFFFQDQQRVAEFTNRRGGFELGLGNTFGSLGQITGGYRWRNVDFFVDVGPSTLPEVAENVGSLWLNFELDRLDRFPYPTGGSRLSVAYEFAEAAFGGDARFHRLLVSYDTYWSPRDRHTFSIGGALGTALGSDLPVYEEFLLGGPAALPGYEREERRGRELIGATLGYRYRIAMLPVGLGRGIYTRLGFSAANVWQTFDDVGKDFRYGGRVGLGLDTILGPVNVDAGFGDGGRQEVYFSAGYSF